MPTRVCAILVTYGDRWDRFGREAADHAGRAGATAVIVVDNGSECAESIDAWARADAEHDAVVVRSLTNEGSSGGFRRGLQAALTLDPEYVWMIDDDMWAPSDSLRKQLEAILASKKPARTVCIGSRDSAATGQFVQQFVLDPGVYIRFDIPTYIAARLGMRIGVKPRKNGEWPEVDLFPYGGSLVPAALLRTGVLPDPKFVVYADDFDWAYRLMLEGAGAVVRTDVQYQVQDRTFGDGARVSALGFFRSKQPTLLHYRVRNAVAFRSALPRTAIQRFRFGLNNLLWKLATVAALATPKWRDNRRIVFRAMRQGREQDFSINPPLASIGNPVA